MNCNKFLPEWYEENWELEEDLASLLKKRAQDKKADELGKEVELHWAGRCWFIPKKSAIKSGKYPLEVTHGSRIEFNIAKGSWEDIYKMLIRLGYNHEELIYFKDDEMNINKRLAIYSDGHIGIIQHPEEKQLGFFSGEDYDIMRTAVDTLFKKDRHLADVNGYLSSKGVEDYNTLIKALKQLDNEEL